MTAWDSTLSGFRNEQRSRILDAVERLMTDRPDRRLTIKAVADEAGLTRPTVYKYFPDLHHIVAETAARWLAVTEDQVARRLQTEPDPGRQLRILLAHLMERLRGSRIGGTSATDISPEAASIVLAEVDKIRAHVERILAAGLAAGSFRADLDPDTDSRVIMVLINGLRAPVADGRVTPEAVDRTIELLSSAIEQHPNLR